MKPNLLCCFIWLLTSLFYETLAQSKSVDSVQFEAKKYSRTFKIDCFLSTSFYNYKNWNGINNSSFIVSGYANLTYKKKKTKSTRIQEYRSEINYQKFIDSLWIKNSDNLFLSSIWLKNERDGFVNSFAISLKTQHTVSWDYSSAKSNTPIWKSGPMLPFALIAGYGINKTFPRDSYFNISFASVKINSMPRSKLNLQEDKFLAKTDKIIFNSEYGLNIQTVLNKIICSRITWENKTSFFTTGLNRKSIMFDMQNIISIKPNRFLKIKFVSNATYDFQISDKLQTKYQLLVGFAIEK